MLPSSGQRPQLVGRARDQARVTDLLGASRPRMVVIEGEPGIGKSALLAWASDHVRADGWLILASRASEAEVGLPFTTIGDLCGPLLDAAVSLPGPQRHALELALSRTDADHSVVDLAALSSGVLALLRQATSMGRVAVVIDDLQWVDPGSARVLGFALRRLDEGSCTVVATRRRSASTGDTLERAFPLDEVARVHLGPLGSKDLHALYLARLGRSFLRPMLVQLHATSGGNPLYALELAKAVLDSDVPVVPYAPFPVPRTLDGLIGARLESLPRRVLRLLSLVALAGRATTASLVLLMQGEEDEVAVRDLLARAAEAGVAGVDASGAVVFTHPLLQSAVHGAVPQVDRQQLHRRLAEVALGIEEQARHLALATDAPDEEVALKLDLAAGTAYRRAALEAAASFAEHAARLTDPRNIDAWVRRGIIAGDYQMKAGDLGRTTELLTDVVARARPGADRARALHRLALARLRTVGLDAAIATNRLALAESHDDELLRVVVMCSLALNLTQTVALRAALPIAEEATRLAHHTGEPDASGRAMTARTYTRFLLGQGFATHDREVTVAGLADHHQDPARVHPVFMPPRLYWAMMTKWADGFAEAKAAFELLYQRAQETRDDGYLTTLLFQLGELQVWMGDHAAARRSVGEARGSAEQFGTRAMSALWLYLEALLAAHGGESAVARAAATQGAAAAAGTSNRLHLIRCVSLLGFIDLAEGRFATAVARYREAFVLTDEAGIADPGVLRFSADGIEALIAADDMEEARERLVVLEEQGRHLDRRWALATAARCQGILLSASGAGRASLVAFDQALVHHESLPQPYERARTLLSMGSAQRRAGLKRSARATFEEAAGAFDALGMPTWAARAREQLLHIGGRAPASTELTPAESEVAGLVAAGLSNPEVAQRAFMSVRTVEAHLTRIYSKLEVRSRAQLAARYRTGRTGAA